MRAALIALLIFGSPGAFAVPPDRSILRPLVGPSLTDVGTPYRLLLTEEDGAFFIRFQAILGGTHVAGRLQRASLDDLAPIARQIDLVPVGRVQEYLQNFAHEYFFVQFDEGQAGSTDITTPNNRVVRRPYVPAYVILEVLRTHGERYVQLHFFRRPNAETLKPMIFAGLHMSSERAKAKADGCKFFFE